MSKLILIWSSGGGVQVRQPGRRTSVASRVQPQDPAVLGPGVLQPVRGHRSELRVNRGATAILSVYHDVSPIPPYWMWRGSQTGPPRPLVFNWTHFLCTIIWHPLNSDKLLKISTLLFQVFVVWIALFKTYFMEYLNKYWLVKLLMF